MVVVVALFFLLVAVALLLLLQQLLLLLITIAGGGGGGLQVGAEEDGWRTACTRRLHATQRHIIPSSFFCLLMWRVVSSS